MNRNGETNIADVTFLIDCLLGSNNDYCIFCADVNGDNDMNIADVTALIDKLLNSGN